MNEEQFEAAKGLIEKWNRESRVYQKQVEAARVRNQNANQDAFMPFRNQEGHMTQLRLCAHELEGALGLRKNCKPQHRTKVNIRHATMRSTRANYSER